MGEFENSWDDPENTVRIRWTRHSWFGQDQECPLADRPAGWSWSVLQALIPAPRRPLDDAPADG